MKGFFLLVLHKEEESPPSSDDLMINPWGFKNEAFHYQFVEKHYNILYDVSIMQNDAWEVCLSHLSRRINKNLRYLIRVNLAHGEVTCSPLGSLS